MRPVICKNTMAEELVYNENLIIQFSTADFQASVLNDDEEVETKHFQSLDAAKRWIDNKTAKKMKITTEMARYIWSIIAANPALPLSWGVNMESFVSCDEALEFHVQGFIHTGNVRITYIEGIDLFQVSLYDEEGNEVKRIDDVYLDNLAEVLDQNVENDLADDYNTKVMNYILGL